MSSLAVRADLIRTLYDQSSPVLLANLLNTTIIAAALWPQSPHPFLLIWVGLMALMTIARVILRRRYLAARPTPEQARAWGRRFAFGSLAAGLLWGVAGVLLFDPDSPMSQLLIVFAIGGMGAGAAGTLSCYLPAFAAYIVPAVALLLIRIVTLGDPLHLAMAAMIAVYGVGLSIVARNTNRAITEAFRLHIANRALLDELAGAQLTLQEANRTLEQKVAERTAAFEQQSEALRSAQRIEAVGRLAGGVAHDFNNLLTVVLANSSLLLEDRTLSPSAEIKVREVHSAAARGADLVRQLLAFGRRQTLAPAEIDLNRVVLELRPLLPRLITERIALEVSVHPSEVFVMVDRTQIEQVLLNLVTNARDAMPQGGRLRISTGIVHAAGEVAGHDRQAGLALLSVEDTGAGMDAETRRRAFEPFFTTKALGRGAGLGLATVHGIIEQSGGHIEVTSAPGNGSRFDVLFPLTQKPEISSDDARVVQGASVTSCATVLMAEDDEMVRSVTAGLLRAMGHKVIVAESGERALELSRQHAGPIDLLVTDVVMGTLDGPALARLVVGERPRTGVLLMSGYSFDHTLHSGDGSQRFEFLQKPFSAEQLREKVTAVLTQPILPIVPNS